jgi:DNA-binding MurR/RpiR family transcriptional regulator
VTTRSKAPPTDHDGFVELLRSQYGSLSKQLRKIAHFVTDHPHDTALETAQVIARRLDVQPSSLIRFASALGYAGFSELQELFRDRLRSQLPSQASDYRDRIAALKRSASAKALTPSIIEQFVTANSHALEQLSAELDRELLEKAAAALGTASTVLVFGVRRSFPAAAYIFYTLEQLEGRVILVDNVGGLHKQQLRNVRKGDVCVIITFPPYAEESLSAARTAREQGATVISFTDGPLSPVTALSTFFFCADRATVSGFRTIAATMCLAQILSIAAGATKTGLKSKRD